MVIGWPVLISGFVVSVILVGCRERPLYQPISRHVFSPTFHTAIKRYR
ncbi:hypothetical protein WMA07_000867 [Klebsiella aerogenes]